MKSLVVVLSLITWVHGSLESSLQASELCPGMEATIRVPASAVGTWWMVMGTPLDSGDCGLSNNQRPCSCVGAEITSNLAPPYIPTYNITFYGYNSSAMKYETTDTTADLVDHDICLAIFNVTIHPSGSWMILSAIDTDNHETFIVLVQCAKATVDGKPIVIILSSVKKGLPYKSWKIVDAVLIKNNICKNYLVPFDTSDCTTPEFCVAD